MRSRKLAVVVSFSSRWRWPGLVVGCGGGFDTVQLTAGPVTGAVQKVDGAQIWTFKGIPYAAPPVGELRWRPPQQVESWTEPLACTEFGPSCPAGRRKRGALLGRLDGRRQHQRGLPLSERVDAGQGRR